MKPGIARGLYDYQQEAIRKTHALKGTSGLFMEMGTGKTRTSLVYVDWRKSRRVLVVCPLSVVGVWEDECEAIGYSQDTIDLTSAGTIPERAVTLRRTGDALALVNYESYWREPLRSAILKWQPDAIVYDEAHRLRNRGSRHSRFAHRLADTGVPVRLALTGTPSVNGLQDFWSIYRAINPTVFGKRWVDFAAQYLVMGGFQNMQIKDYRNVERAEALITENSFQAKKRADLPDRQDVPVHVRLSPETLRQYAELQQKSVIDLTNAAGQPRTIVARIAMTLLLRLQQITSGFVRDTTNEEDIDVGDDKLRTAVGLIEDAVMQGHKVAVFCRFLRDVNRLHAALPGYRVAVFTGRQSSRERSEIRRDFQDGKYDVIVTQIRAASLGIDLTAANIGIFYSIGFSLDDFLQAKDRLHRPGQIRPVTYYHLLARGTVDEKVYDALRAKMSIASRLTDLTYALDMLRV